MLRIGVHAIALALAIGTAHAQEDLQPPVLLQPSVSEVAGRAIDIRGISPGMTADEVRVALLGMFGNEPLAIHEKTATREDRVRLVGVPYVGSLTGKGGTETIRAEFTGVSSANQAVLVQREIEYPDHGEAPLVDELVSSLLDKYGQPSVSSEKMDATFLLWMFKDGAIAACERNTTPQCLQPESAVMNAADASQFFDVVVMATVARSAAQSDRVALLVQSSTDLSIKVAADAADRQGLITAFEAAGGTAEIEAAPLPPL